MSTVLQMSRTVTACGLIVLERWLLQRFPEAPAGHGTVLTEVRETVHCGSGVDVGAGRLIVIGPCGDVGPRCCARVDFELGSRSPPRTAITELATRCETSRYPQLRRRHARRHCVERGFRWCVYVRGSDWTSQANAIHGDVHRDDRPCLLKLIRFGGTIHAFLSMGINVYQCCLQGT